MVVDFNRMSIAIATHYRPVTLQAAADAWAATAPAYREMRIIVNHPEGVATFKPPARCAVTRLDWPPEQRVGCLAKMWNLAMLWAFRDPEVEWLLCSEDDVEVLPGWPAALERRDADLYLAPTSDLIFLFNREVFRRVGWFDERFTVCGYQDWDWEARVVRTLGAERVTIDDQHGWEVSPIGLGEFWKHVGGGAAPTSRDLSFQHVSRLWLEEKWGISGRVGSDFWYAAMTGPGPKVPEIDWYPWVKR